MSVHSEALGITLDGNIITHHKRLLHFIMDASQTHHSIAVVRSGGTDDCPLFDVSYAMNEHDHMIYAGLIHRQKSENKLKKGVDNSKPTLKLVNK